MESRVLALAASPLVYLGMYLFSLIDGFFPPIPSESLAIALAALSASSGQPNLALIILFAVTGPSPETRSPTRSAIGTVDGRQSTTECQ